MSFLSSPCQHICLLFVALFRHCSCSCLSKYDIKRIDINYQGQEENMHYQGITALFPACSNCRVEFLDSLQAGLFVCFALRSMSEEPSVRNGQQTGWPGSGDIDHGPKRVSTIKNLKQNIDNDCRICTEVKCYILLDDSEHAVSSPNSNPRNSTCQMETLTSAAVACG